MIRGLKKSVYNYYEGLKYTFILPFIGRKDYGKFILLTRSRTGSSLLRDLLNSHPNILIRGEIFGLNKEIESVTSVLNRVWNFQPGKIKVSGFKIFYNQLFHQRHEQVFKAILEDQNIKIIHLKRNNLIEAEFSAERARKTGVWHSRPRNTKQALMAFELDPIEVECRIEETLKNYEQINALFGGHPIIEISYEELVDSMDITLHKIAQFLNVKYHNFETTFVKQDNLSFQATISNYLEVKRYFEETKWAKYFEAAENSSNN